MRHPDVVPVQDAGAFAFDDAGGLVGCFGVEYFLQLHNGSLLGYFFLSNFLRSEVLLRQITELKPRCGGEAQAFPGAARLFQHSAS
ncbi:hypothetical protein D3C71_1766510 [compost metagenome]